MSSVGPLRVEFSSPVSLEQIKKDNPDVQLGGRYQPKDCQALQKVAIIIPFRKRDEHLKYWLYYLHPILRRQQLDYGVYIVNQVRRDGAAVLLWFITENDDRINDASFRWSHDVIWTQSP